MGKGGEGSESGDWTKLGMSIGGAAIGTMIAPGVGTAAGWQLGSMAGDMTSKGTGMEQSGKGLAGMGQKVGGLGSMIAGGMGGAGAATGGVTGAASATGAGASASGAGGLAGVSGSGASLGANVGGGTGAFGAGIGKMGATGGAGGLSQGAGGLNAAITGGKEAAASGNSILDSMTKGKDTLSALSGILKGTPQGEEMGMEKPDTSIDMPNPYSDTVTPAVMSSFQRTQFVDNPSSFSRRKYAVKR